VSVTDAGAQGNGDSSDANIAPQGLFVTFTSKATNLATDANGAVSDVFVVSAPDRTTGNTAAPTATIAQADQPQAVIGEQFIQFVVTYNDDVDLAPTSFDSSDVTVTPPGGGAALPVELVTSTGSGTQAKVVYRIQAPGGTVDDADAGQYTVNIQANQVQDANGNSVAAGALSPVTVTPAAASGPDLVPSIPTAPPAAVGGSKGQVKVVVTNQGDQPVPKKSSMNLQLWLSSDGTIDANDTLLVQQTKKFSAKPGKGKKYTLKYTYNAPAGGPNYQLLAFADAGSTIAESRENNNVASAAVVVAPPFIDFATTVNTIKATAVSGKKFTVPVTITNNGNVPSKGTATFTILATTHDAPGNSDDVSVTTVTKPLNVKNGKSKKLKLTVLLPTLAPGNYRFIVSTAFTGNLADAVAINDIGISPNPTAVA
jgi:CARDB